MSLRDQQTLPERVRALLAASEREYQRSQTGTEEEAYYNGQGAAFQAVLDLLTSSQEPSLDAERLARAIDSIDHDHRVGDDTTTEQYAALIAAEYDRLR